MQGGGDIGINSVALMWTAITSIIVHVSMNAALFMCVSINLLISLRES